MTERAEQCSVPIAPVPAYYPIIYIYHVYSHIKSTHLQVRVKCSYHNPGIVHLLIRKSDPYLVVISKINQQLPHCNGGESEWHVPAGRADRCVRQYAISVYFFSN